MDRIAAHRGRTPDLPEHLLAGIAGEEAAFLFLLGKGFTVVARRWSSGDTAGDLDLIAWHGSVLCFFEIKTRSVRDPNPAEATIDLPKRNRLRRLAHQYLRQLPEGTQPPTRFDTIGVYMEPGRPPELTHSENAFGGIESRSPQPAARR